MLSSSGSRATVPPCARSYGTGARNHRRVEFIQRWRAGAGCRRRRRRNRARRLRGRRVGAPRVEPHRSVDDPGRLRLVRRHALADRAVLAPRSARASAHLVSDRPAASTISDRDRRPRIRRRLRWTARAQRRCYRHPCRAGGAGVHRRPRSNVGRGAQSWRSGTGGGADVRECSRGSGAATPRRLGCRPSDGRRRRSQPWWSRSANAAVLEDCATNSLVRSAIRRCRSATGSTNGPATSTISASQSTFLAPTPVAW